MMRFNRSIVSTVGILLFALPIGIIVSCLPDDCEGIGPYYVAFEEIAATNVRFAEGQSLSDTLARGATVAYNEYAIVTRLLIGSATGATPEPTGSWFSSAYACDPAPIPVDTVVAIMVTSNADYTASGGNTVAAGESLNAFLRIGFSNTVSSFESLSDYTGDLSRLAYSSYAVLTLNKAPAEPQTHQFTVRYQLADGRELWATTAPVVIFE